MTTVPAGAVLSAARCVSMPRASVWTDEELAILDANPELSAAQVAKLLPGRSGQAVGNKRANRHRGGFAYQREQPPVIEPGEYIETLWALLVDDFEIMGVWLKWHGYASYRELGRDRFDWVTVLCTAK